MAGDEVDARVGAPSGGRIEIRAAGEPVGELTQCPLRAAPEVSHRVPVLAVPFGPEHRKLPTW